MKHITKEWYKNVQEPGPNILFGLEIFSEANTFSEEVFQEQYNKRLDEWIERMQAYPSEQSSKEMFIRMYEMVIEQIPTHYPKDILDNVADIRLLALGKVTEDNYVKINEIIKNRHEISESAFKNYNAEYQLIKGDLPKNLREKLSLHDCKIDYIDCKDNNMIIGMESNSGSGQLNKMIFRDYNIIEKEVDFIDGWILNTEIYIVDDKYELHLMIHTPAEGEENWNMGYFTIQAKDIFIESEGETFEEWVDIKDQKDIDMLIDKVQGFHDSCIKEICYSSGNYVNNNKSMGYDKKRHNVKMIFQSQGCGSFEILFKEIKNIKINKGGNYFGEISDCTLFIVDGYVYWADAFNWDKDNPDFYSDTNYVVAKQMSYKTRKDINDIVTYYGEI